MTPQRIFQTPGRVLEFEGELLASASSRGEKASARRWWNYDLYASEQNLILRIDYCSTWPGDPWTCQAHVCSDDVELELVIRTHLAGILDMTLGFPPIERFQARRRTLVGYLQRDAQQALNSILSTLGVRRVD